MVTGTSEGIGRHRVDLGSLLPIGTWVVATATDATGDIALNGEVIALDTLDRKLHEDAAARKVQGAVVRADRRLPHGDVVRVLGIVRDSGIREVGIAVR